MSTARTSSRLHNQTNSESNKAQANNAVMQQSLDSDKGVAQDKPPMTENDIIK